MSTLVDYNKELFKNYDDTRSALYMELYMGFITYHIKKPLSEIRVLDVGCGTGNYTKALLDTGIGHVSGLDGSKLMLDKAKDKMADYMTQNRCDLNVVTLPDLSKYECQDYHVVMFNHVIHHLDNTDGKFPVLQKVLNEVRRVLKPGGFCFISHPTPDQLTNGFAWNSFIPEATKRIAYRCPSAEQLNELFHNAGLSMESQYVPLDVVLQGNSYFDMDGPLDEKWRAGDSTWVNATGPEIASCVNRIKELKKEDKLEEEFKKADAQRLRIGQCTVFIARLFT